VVAGLTVPDVMAKGDVALSASADTMLAANTTYHFVLYTTGSVDLRVVASFSSDEDADIAPRIAPCYLQD
jgi:hypothetical protein